jgi:molybdopterin biosynthesis enzyme MoaB
VYVDKGCLRWKEWLGRALRNPSLLTKRLIPDEQAGISAALIEWWTLVALVTDHRRHRSGATRRSHLKPLGP